MKDIGGLEFGLDPSLTSHASEGNTGLPWNPVLEVPEGPPPPVAWVTQHPAPSALRTLKSEVGGNQHAPKATGLRNVAGRTTR